MPSYDPPSVPQGRGDSESSELVLKALFRLLGTSSLCALIFVVAPRAWMVSIHSDLGMGSLPDATIVWYLARSTSALYAFIGGLFWFISFDLRRYRPLVSYLGATIIALGLVLLFVDWVEDLPIFWKFWEGPFMTAVGLVVLVLSRRIRPNSGQAVRRVAGE